MAAPAFIIQRKTDTGFSGEVEGLENIGEYTIVMTVKKDRNDPTPTFTVEAEIEDNTATFVLTNTMTDKEPGVYYFDIIAGKDGKRFVLTEPDKFFRIVRGVSE